MNTNMWGDFQICISVPLNLDNKKNDLKGYIFSLSFNPRVFEKDK